MRGRDIQEVIRLRMRAKIEEQRLELERERAEQLKCLRETRQRIERVIVMLQAEAEAA